MSSGKRKAERGDGRGGGFLLLPHCVMESEAFRTASPRAIKVLLGLCLKHNGFNNGSIGMGFRDLAEWMGNQNHTANGRALCELIERGLAAPGKCHPKGQRLAWEYRLTFVPTGEIPATNEYLSWKQGDAGTKRKAPEGKKRVAKTSTRTALRVVKTSTGEEISRCENLSGGHANPPFSERPRVEAIATHIVQPSGGLPESAEDTPPIHDGPLSAAPDAEELRGRVLSVLGNAARGSQGQLAALAAIRPAALSKFLNECGSLNDHARLRLTLALPKIAALQAA